MPDFSYFLPEDDPELREAASAEATGLKVVKPESRRQFLSALGSAPALTGAQRPQPYGGPQELATRAREGGSQYADFSHFVNTATNMFLNFGPEMPLSWLARQSPRDLELLDGLLPNGTQWIIDAKEDMLAEVQDQILAQLEIERTVQSLVDFEMDAAESHQARRENEGLVSTYLGTLFSRQAGESVFGVANQELLEDIPREERERRIRAWVEANYDPTQPRPDYWAYYNSPDGPGSFIYDIGSFIGAGMEGIVNVVDALAQLEAHTQDLINTGEWNGPAVAARLNKAAQLQQQQYEAMLEDGIISRGWGTDLASAKGHLVAAAKAQELAPEALWEMYKRESPEEAEEFLMGFAFGDEQLAMHGFHRLFQDLDEEGYQAAVEDLNEALTDQEWQMIEALREPDTAENIRAQIATYGEWVEENGTYLATIFGESFKAITDSAVAFNWDEIKKRASHNREHVDHAAEYFGLQGTILGLAINGFFMGVGDPLNYLGVPRLGLAAAKVFKASYVKRFVNSAKGAAQLQDAVWVARSGHRGEMATMAFLDEMDAIGLGDEFYALAGGREPIIPKGKWVKGPKGHAASEVSLSKLLDDLGLDPGDAPAGKADELLEKGLDEAVTVHFNSAEGVAWIDEADYPILAALREVGEDTVPIALKHTYDTPIAKKLAKLDDRIAALQAQVDEGAVSPPGTRALSKNDETALREQLREIDTSPEDIEAAVFRAEMEAEELRAQALEGWEAANEELGVLQLERQFLLDERPGRALDEMGWRTPEQLNADGYASVRNALPDETVYGADVPWERLRQLQERAYLLGAGFSSPRAMMISAAFPGEVRNVMQQMAAGKAPWKAVARWFRRDNILTGYTWTGKTWNRQVRHTILRLFGDDEVAVEGLLREWRSILRRRADNDVRRRELKGQIATLRGRAKDFEEKALKLDGRNFEAAADETFFDGPAILAEIQANPDDFVFHATRPELADKIEKTGQTKGGFTTQQRAEEMYTGETGRVGGREILVYRKSDLYPFQQRALERSELGEIGEFGAEGVPGIKPVARYNADEGLESLANKRMKDPLTDVRREIQEIGDEIGRIEAEIDNMIATDGTGGQDYPDWTEFGPEEAAVMELRDNIEASEYFGSLLTQRDELLTRRDELLEKRRLVGEAQKAKRKADEQVALRDMTDEEALDWVADYFVAEHEMISPFIEGGLPRHNLDDVFKELARRGYTADELANQAMERLNVRMADVEKYGIDAPGPRQLDMEELARMSDEEMQAYIDEVNASGPPQWRPEEAAAMRQALGEQIATAFVKATDPQEWLRILETRRANMDDLADFYQRNLEQQLEDPGFTGDPTVARDGLEEIMAAKEQLDRDIAIYREKAKTDADRYRAMQDEIRRLEDELTHLDDNIDNRELNAFMVRMWEEYNRKYIAPTGKYKVDPETGLVPWEELRPGSRAGQYSVYNNGEQIYLPDARQAALDAEGVLPTGETFEQFALDKFGPLKNVQGWNAPISILDLHAARTFTRAQYLKWKSFEGLERLREFTHGALRLWKIDKVFRPATAMVATFDELYRMWKTFGPNGFFTWMDDKMRSTSEFFWALGSGFKKANRELGWMNRDRVPHNIVTRWEKRRQMLADGLPQQFRMMNRHFDEEYGEGFTQILPGEQGYVQEAERWTAQALGDSGFRAAIQGRKAWDEWWDNHPDAERLKAGTTHTKDGRRIPNRMMKDAIEEGYLNFLNKVFLAKHIQDGKGDAALRAWVETARRIEASGGSATAHTLPKWVLKDVGPITGIRRGAPGGSVLSKMSNSMMDTLFMQPARYRQQFLAAQIRKYEEKRLHTLLTDQGYKIVPDDVIEEMTGGKFSITRASQEWGQLEEILQEFGIVPESWIRRLAENKAVEEAEHIMYAWHKTSRIGRSIPGQATIPFGAPWADMWGFYGREMLMPMMTRGLLNREVLNIPIYAQAVANWLPSLRTAATISKVAATEFDTDRGFVGEGDWGLNFSPLFFLPTEGENPFMTLLPGFGAIPMMLLDTAIAAMADPEENPERYQFIIEQVSDYLPPAGFQQQGAGRLLGGGWIGNALKAMSDVSGVAGAGYFNPIHQLIGDITVETATTRNIRALLADPDNWADLVEAESGDEYSVHYRGIVAEAFQRASGGHLGELSVRQLVPARGDFDPAADELLDVWLNAARTHEALAVPGLEKLDMTDNEALIQVADDIRTKFWGLPQHERDLLIIQNPELIVNMVGGWEWTDKGEAALPEDAGTPYRTTGGPDALARHQTYIKLGYIKPRDPSLLVHSIIGTYFEARERAATRVYELTVQDRNDWAWENMVSPQWKAWFEQAATVPEIAEYLQEGTAQEVWQRWGTLESVYEEAWMRGTGVDPETADEETKARYNVSLPTEAEAWSSSWRGMDDENFAKRFTESPIPTLTPEAVEILNVLGASVTLEGGLTGEQLLSAIHQELSADVVENPAKVRSAAEHAVYLGSRGDTTAAALTMLGKAAVYEGFDQDYRALNEKLLRLREQNLQIRAEEGLIPPDRQNMVREVWNEMRLKGADTPFDYDEIWKDLFARDYGPQDWTPPVPPEEPLNPYPITNIRTVLDGDTLVVQMENKPQLYKVRLLGIDAAEIGNPGAADQQRRLKQTIMNATRRGARVEFIPDTNTTGGRYTDAYGRLLGWLFIDGVPYYFPNEVSP